MDRQELIDQLQAHWETLLKKGNPRDAGDGWFEIDLPPIVSKNCKGECRMYNKCLLPDEPAILTLMTEEIDKLWHMSISWNPMIEFRQRVPSWEEMRDARYKFLPGSGNFAVMMPPKEFYVNVHPNCMHVYQIPVGYATDPVECYLRQEGEGQWFDKDVVKIIHKLYPDFDEAVKTEIHKVATKAADRAKEQIEAAIKEKKNGDV